MDPGRPRQRKSPRRKARFRVEGLTAAQLGAKVGVSARTVKHYLAQGVLPATTFRGAATRYGHQHLLCLAAIRWLQREQRLSLQAIRLKWRTFSAEDVVRMASALLPELAVAASPVAPPAQLAASRKDGSVSDTWQRLTILPGLELHLHSAASDDVQRLARELSERLRSGSSAKRASEATTQEPSPGA